MVEEGAYLRKEGNRKGGQKGGGRENEKERQIETEANKRDCGRKGNLYLRVHFSLFLSPVEPLP